MKDFKGVWTVTPAPSSRSSSPANPGHEGHRQPRFAPAAWLSALQNREDLQDSSLPLQLYFVAAVFGACDLHLHMSLMSSTVCADMPAPGWHIRAVYWHSIESKGECRSPIRAPGR